MELDLTPGPVGGASSQPRTPAAGALHSRTNLTTANAEPTARPV